MFRIRIYIYKISKSKTSYSNYKFECFHQFTQTFGHFNRKTPLVNVRSEILQIETTKNNNKETVLIIPETLCQLK